MIFSRIMRLTWLPRIAVAALAALAALAAVWGAGDVLPEETRAQVRASLERGMRRQGETMVRLALRHRRADVVAPLVQNDNRLAAVLKAGVARHAPPRPAPR